MGKVFLWIGVVMLAIFIVKTQFLASKTWTPFRDGCLAGGTATQAQCDCLSDYVHKRFSDLEVKRIMANEITDQRFADRVKQTIVDGTQSCRGAQ